MFRRYLTVWASVVGLGLGGAAAVNLIVDPFGVYPLAGLDRISPYRNGIWRTAKAELVIRARDYTLIVGTSRAEVCLDPEDPALGGQLTINAGLSATNMLEIERVIAFALEHNPPERIILAIDFLAFTGARSTGDDFANSRFNDELDPFTYRVETLLGLRVCKQSVNAVLRAVRRQPRHSQSDTGFYRCKPEDITGSQRGLFELVLREFATNPSTYGNYAPSADRIERFGRALHACAGSGVEVHLLIPPIHAAQLALIDEMGLWDEFEAWKRDVVRTAEEFGYTPIWDFAFAGPAQTEPIPSVDDLRTRMVWFFESSHARPILGGIALARAFDAGRPTGVEEETWQGVGSPLTVSLIDEALVRQRADLYAWRRERPRDAALAERAADREP